MKIEHPNDSPRVPVEFSSVGDGRPGDTAAPQEAGAAVCLKSAPEITGRIVRNGLLSDEVVVLWDDTGDKWTIGRDRLVFLSDDQDVLKRQLLGSALIGTLERLRDDIDRAIADVERVMK